MTSIKPLNSNMANSLHLKNSSKKKKKLLKKLKAATLSSEIKLLMRKLPVS